MNTITVTSPLFPPLETLEPYLKDIWDKKWLTNNGYYHQCLENALCEYLDVPYISLYSNGTLALIAAINVLELQGEVITTPYSFVATSHSLLHSNISPVFVDIEPDTYNIDPSKIEAAITDKTSAILPVHVYGRPCNYEAIQKIADKYNIPVIYDAAHAFGVKENNQSILKKGDLSILSFHATKTYSTIEGGAIICHTKEMKEKLDRYKNFGYTNETVIDELGFNAKLNEVQAAFGLATLNYIDEAIDKRRKVSEFYHSHLSNMPGITLPTIPENLRWNYSYYPIIIDENKYSKKRDELYLKLKDNNIISRRYFYPLITDFNIYSQYKVETPIAKKISENVICLPIHHLLSDNDLYRIINVIKSLK